MIDLSKTDQVLSYNIEKTPEHKYILEEHSYDNTLTDTSTSVNKHPEKCMSQISTSSSTYTIVNCISPQDIRFQFVLLKTDETVLFFFFHAVEEMIFPRCFAIFSTVG